MSKLKTMTSVISGLLLSASYAYGAGTGAGTPISNQATVSYNAGAGSVTVPSNSVSFNVDELIKATLTAQYAGDISVSAGQIGAVQKFQITNTGNGSEAFVISSINLPGNQFDVSNFKVYEDSGADEASLDLADDTLLASNSTKVLSPDESIVIWITADIPSTSLNDNDKSTIQVSAMSNTFSTSANTTPDIGDSLANAGDSNTFAVYGISGLLADNAAYVISDIDVSIVKAVATPRDNLSVNGNKAVPGAEVDYTLTVTVTGTGTANNVVVTDKLPDNGAVPPIQYLMLKDGTSGIIKVDGTDLSASAATDPSAKYDANTHTITVDLGSIDAGDPAIAIQFTTVIQ